MPVAAPSDPLLAAVETYLADESGEVWEAGDIASAYAAERAAQTRVCRVPASPADYPADLVEALCRRIHRNLAVRKLPLGFQALSSDAAVTAARVGQDPEVRRLEAPFRKLVCG